MMPQITLRLVAIIAAVIAALWAVWFAYDLLTAGDKARAKLGANQTDAAVASGTDAVETVGNRNATEKKIDDKTESVNNEIRNSDNASDIYDALIARLRDDPDPSE